MIKLLISLTLMCIPYASIATIIYVNPDGSGDYPTIQAAIKAANGGDQIHLGDGVFTGPGNRELIINHGIDFRSAGGIPENCVIDAEGYSFGEGFGSYTFFFYGIGFRNGTQLDLEALSAGFTNCLFENCAGIANVSNPSGIEFSSLHLTGCRISGNHSWATTTAYVIAIDCVFENCSGDLLACIRIGAQNCEFRDNVSNTPFIMFFSADTFSGRGNFLNCRFLRNEVPTIILSEGGAPAEFADCIFAFNSETCINGGNLGWGGDRYNLYRCTFVANGTNGGEDLRFSSSATANQCLFAYRQGGTVADEYPPYGAPELIDCNLYANAGGDWAGGIADQFGIGCNMSENPMFCDWAGGDFTLYAGSPCLPENNACGVQIGAFGQGCLDPTAVDTAPGNTQRLVAHPNPFNPMTRLSFTLPEAGPVTLTVHDAAGRRVATPLDAELRAAGAQAFDWQAGSLPSGIYLARLRHRGGLLTEKLILLR